ncbi:hypothetical protein [Diaphorobacter caeni]|uniref:hypothetical protein n=1 Tax=Diaphorobacter caeni TaxID=2784387 RepID=UPI00188F5371|nr:hypothetical protein [Diaphorobacter caeni]MBF5007612.1 hypothetical protein [Diaphorobacter caeni]
MTTQPSNDSKCRQVFEREYFADAPAHASERNANGEYKYMASQVAWTHFRYGWLAKERAE